MTGLDTWSHVEGWILCQSFLGLASYDWLVLLWPKDYRRDWLVLKQEQYLVKCGTWFGNSVNAVCVAVDFARYSSYLRTFVFY